MRPSSASGERASWAWGLRGDSCGAEPREKDNAIAYGEPVPAMSILRGEVAAPPEAAKLQEALVGY
jgi:hypothetical protein